MKLLAVSPENGEAVPVARTSGFPLVSTPDNDSGTHGHPEADRRLAKACPEHASYRSMVSRCTRPADKDYPRYGGAGIRVCKRWLGRGGFWRFLADMGPRPEGAGTIERKENSKGYTPTNCRWATWTEQQNNRRSNRLVTIDGVTRSAADWARAVGLPRRQIVTNRLQRGWHPRAAVYGGVTEAKLAAHARLGVPLADAPPASAEVA